jgi:hypothetical protein
MRKAARIFTVLFIAAAGLFAAGCPDRTSIADIERNPSRHINKEVVIAGVVKDSYGVSVPGTNIRGGIYKVDDGTGSIWVVTENTVPVKGAEVGVKGTVGNGVSWNGRNYGLGMHETSRKYGKK